MTYIARTNWPINVRLEEHVLRKARDIARTRYSGNLSQALRSAIEVGLPVLEAMTATTGRVESAQEEPHGQR